MGKPSSMDVDFVSKNNSSPKKSNGNFQNWLCGFFIAILPLVIIALLKSLATKQDCCTQIVYFIEVFFSDFELLYICVTLILPAMFEIFTKRGRTLLFHFLFCDLVFCCVLYGILKWSAELENSPSISINYINAAVIAFTFFLGCAAFIKRRGEN